MRRSTLHSAALLACFLSAPLGSLLAFDPTLVDALLDKDAAVRKTAYEQMYALSEPDKANLAPFLSDRLDDPTAGERAAIALCRIGDVGVPFLDRHARSSIPGADFATMGLLAGTDSGLEAIAGILRNGDEPAVMRTLGIIESTTMMPPVVAAEVQRLSEDSDLHFAKAARAALDAVAKANADKASAKDPGDLKSELARLSKEAPPSGVRSPGDENLKKLVGTLQASGPEGQQALKDALASGSIDKTTYDQIQSMLGAAPTVDAPSSASGGGMQTWQPDTSSYESRQSATDVFSKNRKQ